jgi:D-alanyl-D-alanine carboxypeptidase/D-alanyl-D-alanine-endopeptidase (penicillin-binding protein 4)
LQISGQLAADAQPDLQAMAVIDPGETFLRHLRVALVGQQIKVANAQVVSTNNINHGKELAAVESAPLASLLVETNQNSNNLYAEALLRLLGATNQELATNNQDTAEIGLTTVKQTLTNLGVDPESYKLVDGSGLSRHNLVTPNAIVQTLKAMAKSPYAEYYRASLPVAGVSGTLKTRLRDTPAQGILSAKTGTMTGVVALSGYLNAPIDQPLVFSILVNQSDQSASVIRQAMDEIVLLLTRVRSCQ